MRLFVKPGRRVSRPRSLLLCALGSLALIASACGGSDSESKDSKAPSSANDQASAVSAATTVSASPTTSAPAPSTDASTTSTAASTTTTIPLPTKIEVTRTGEFATKVHPSQVVGTADGAFLGIERSDSGDARLVKFGPGGEELASLEVGDSFSVYALFNAQESTYLVERTESDGRCTIRTVDSGAVQLGEPSNLDGLDSCDVDPTIDKSNPSVVWLRSMNNQKARSQMGQFDTATKGFSVINVPDKSNDYFAVLDVVDGRIVAQHMPDSDEDPPLPVILQSWDPATGQMGAEVELPLDYQGVAVQADGTLVAFSDSGDELEVDPVSLATKPWVNTATEGALGAPEDNLLIFRKDATLMVGVRGRQDIAAA